MTFIQGSNFTLNYVILVPVSTIVVKVADLMGIGKNYDRTSGYQLLEIRLLDKF
jgi:hypothetical protein